MITVSDILALESSRFVICGLFGFCSFEPFISFLFSEKEETIIGVSQTACHKRIYIYVYI